MFKGKTDIALWTLCDQQSSLWAHGAQSELDVKASEIFLTTC